MDPEHPRGPFAFSVHNGVAPSVGLRAVAFGFLAGVGLRSFVREVAVDHGYTDQPWALPTLVVSGLGAVALLIILKERGSRSFVLVSLGTIALLGGFFRFQFSIARQPVMPQSPEVLRGTVIGLPKTFRRATAFPLELAGGGTVAVSIPTVDSGRDLHLGTRIEVFCRIHEDTAHALHAERAVYSQRFRAESEGRVGQCAARRFRVAQAPSWWYRLRAVPERARAWIAGRVEASMHGQAGEMLRSFAFGTDPNIDPATIEAFRRAGTLHILVVSGSQFSLLASIIESLGSVVSLAPSVVAGSTAALLGFFLAMIGAPAAAVRGYSASLSVTAARILQRPRAGLHVLLLIAAGMVFARPWLLVFNLGFQLSVLASAAIIAFTRPIDDWLLDRFRWQRFGSIRGIAASSLAAIAATAPLLGWAFGSVSLVSPVANVAALVLAPSLLLVSLAFSSVAVLSLPLATALSPLPSIAFQIFTELIRAFADAPVSSVSLGAIPTAVIAAYYALFFLVVSRAGRAALSVSPRSGIVVPRS